MKWVYTDKVKDHFMNPRNVVEEEEDTWPFDGKGVVGNIKCGDEMAFYIQVDKDKNVIKDCRWKTYGCASAIASTSVLSEMVKGMTLEEAFRLTPKDVVKELQDLPDHKIHCSVLGDKALRSAINNYYELTDQHDKIKKETVKVICQCMNVTDHEIEDQVLEGARSFADLQERTKCSTVCGKCQDEVTQLVGVYIDRHFSK